MKHNSRKILSSSLIIFLTIALIGCKSTPTAEVEEIPATAAVVEKPAEKTVEAEPIKEEVVVEVQQQAEEEIKEQPKTEEEKVEEPQVKEITDYPYGVKEIVKSEGNDVFDLFIVHTGDVQGSLEGSSESVGYAILKTMLDVARSITDNILLLDAGNTMAGSPLVDQYLGEPAGVLLDVLGYDAIGVAEKEFAYGIERLVEASKLAKELSSIKVLSANTLDSNDYLYFQPYQVYNYNGFKVAVVALTDFMNVDGVVFDSEVVMNNAQAAVGVAKQYVDYVVVLGNFGANANMAEQVIEYLGADLWIDGYAKAVPETGKMIGDTLYVGSGKNFSKVGIVDILVENNEVIKETAIAITAEDVNNPKESALAKAYNIVAVPADEEVKQYIDTLKATLKVESSKVEEKAGEVAANTSEVVLANIPNALVGESDVIGVKKSEFTEMLTEAMTAKTDADFSIINSGAISSSIEEGAVTKADIEKALASDNVLTVIELSGEQVYQALEHGYSMLPEASSIYSQTDLVVIYNKFAKPGKRIIRLRTKEGEKIDKEATYKVATTDYLADGGDDYPWWFTKILSQETPLAEVFEDYLSMEYPVK